MCLLRVSLFGWTVVRQWAREAPSQIGELSILSNMAEVYFCQWFAGVFNMVYFVGSVV